MNIKALTSSTFVAVVVSFFEMGLIGFGSRQIVRKYVNAGVAVICRYVRLR